MAEREGEGGDRSGQSGRGFSSSSGMGGSRPSPAAAVPGAGASAPTPTSPAPKAAVPQHVVDRLKAVYAEVTAAAKESKALHERLGRHPEAEAARVIAARLATIEEHIKSLV